MNIQLVDVYQKTFWSVFLRGKSLSRQQKYSRPPFQSVFLPMEVILLWLAKDHTHLLASVCSAGACVSWVLWSLSYSCHLSVVTLRQEQNETTKSKTRSSHSHTSKIQKIETDSSILINWMTSVFREGVLPSENVAVCTYSVMDIHG